MKSRLHLYLVVLPLGLALPALMIWFPEKYTIGLDFVLNHLRAMVALPIVTFSAVLPEVRAEARAPYRTWLPLLGLALLVLGLIYYMNHLSLAVLGYVTVIPAFLTLFGAILFPTKSQSE